MNFEIEGDPEVFERLKEAAVQALTYALGYTCLSIQSEARNLVPKFTGGLAQSVRYNVDVVSDTEISALIGSMGVNSKYARAIEYGLKPGHFMPRSAIEGQLAYWVRLKGLTGSRRKSKNNIDEATSIAWAIAKHIEQAGTQSHPFLYPAIQNGAGRIQNFIDSELKKMRMAPNE